MRDYSTQAAKHRHRKRKGPSAAVGITLSIIITGVAVASLIWLNQSASEKKGSSVNGQSLATSVIDASPAAEETKAIQHEIPEATENFYTFYELLITGEVPINIEDGKIQDDAISLQLKSKVIQVASFRTHEAAERIRVELLFLNLKARVIPPKLNNSKWYRIVLGPFKTKRDMSAAADILTKNGFEAQVRKE